MQCQRNSHLCIYVELCLFLVQLSAWSQPIDHSRRPSPEMREAVKQELQHEIRTYSLQNILPVMNTWKQRLDASLDSMDLFTLNELRSEAARLKAQRMRFRSGMRDSRPLYKEESAREWRDSVKLRRAQWTSLFESLQPIAMQNSEVVNSIAEEARPFIHRWRDEIRVLISQWATRHHLQPRLTRHLLRTSTRHLSWGLMSPDRGEKARKIKGARFLLWDGHPFLLGDAQYPRNPGSGNSEISRVRISNHPNPFPSSTIITYTVPESCHVQLTVQNRTGATVATLVDQESPSGTFTVRFDGSALPNGSYDVRLLAGQHRQVHHMRLIK